VARRKACRSAATTEDNKWGLVHPRDSGDVIR
jgi:hypothetical protein